MKNEKFKDEKSRHGSDEYEFIPRGKKQSPSKKKKAQKMSTKKIIGISLGSAAAVIIVVMAGLLTYSNSVIDNNAIAQGLYVGNINLSGLTLSEAEAALEGYTPEEPYEIILECEDKSFVLDTSELDYTIDHKTTAKKAFEYGKTNNAFKKISLAFSASKTTDVLPAFVFDDTQVAEKLNIFGEQVLGTMTDHSVEVKEDKIVITPGTPGYDNNPMDALGSLDFALQNQISNVVKVRFNHQYPELMTVEKLSGIVSADGLDAAFKLENGQVIVTEGRSGYTFDEGEAIDALTKLQPGEAPVEISCIAVPPTISSDELRAKLFNKELASYSTRYNAGQVNRSKNVAVAAGKLDGVIILPGETLSFNQVVGKRTTANGFMPAPEYQNGKSVTGIGGGTCQVSTTLYSAALYANLEIVSRRNHSMSVAYVPLGQDATVTDGGTDLKIKNNTKYPIKLDTSAGGGTITVRIIGTAPEPPVSVKIINTKTSALSATTTRVIYDASGKEISRELIATSKYKPHGSSDEEPAVSEAPAPTATPAPNATQAPENTQMPENTQATEGNTTPDATQTPGSSGNTESTKAPFAPTKEPENTETSGEVTPPASNEQVSKQEAESNTSEVTEKQPEVAQKIE